MSRERAIPAGIREHRGAWQVRVYAGRQDGRPLHLTRTVHGPLALAVKVRDELTAEVVDARERRVGGLARTTVAGYYAEWTEGLEATGMATSTARGYRDKLSTWVLPRLGDRQLDSVRPAEIKAIYTAQHQAGRKLWTTHGLHNALARFFADAVADGAAAASPMPHVQRPAVRMRPPEPPSTAEVVALIAEADRYVNRDVGVFVRVAFATGARRGEVNALQWHDVDFDRGTIHIRRATAGEAAGELTTKATKTHADAVVPIDYTTAAVLRRHRRRAAETALAAGTTLSSRAFVVSPDPLGRTQYTPHWSTRAWAKIRARAGLEHVPLKNLRHAAATTALDAGVPLKDVSHMLRHSKEATTLTFYAGRSAAMARRASDALGDVARLAGDG